MKNTQTIKDLKTVQSALRLLSRREREKAREAAGLSNRCSAHAQTASRALTIIRRLAKTVGLALLAGLLAVSSASADDHSRRERREHHNWILERQEAGQVSGVPTSRRIIGNRELDVYPDGSMFEKNNYVGQAR